MLRYIVKRILQLIPTLLLVSIIVFLMVRIIPGDPITLLYGVSESGGASEEYLESMREMYGLNDPLIVQYLRWITGFIRGDKLKRREEIMRKTKLLALALSAVMSVSLLAGCGSSGGSTSGDASGDAGSVSYKDTITIATNTDQNYMDGQMNNTSDVYLRAVYSQLVRRNTNNELEGDLAESWEVSEDGCTWTFHLKQGVKFHSGKELTAADVKASYDRLVDEENPVRYTSLATGYISECNVVDDYTVQLVTPTPIAAFLANLTHRSNLILNSDYIEQYGAELGLTAESVDGTGPYKLASWDREQEMVLERFDDYYAGAVPTKTIDILVVPDANARQVALETGDVDITTVATSEVPALVQNDSLQILMFEGIGSHGLQFNCANEYLKDTRLRQAVSYAIDRQAIIDALYSDIGERACTAPVNPNVWGYCDFGVIEQDQEKAKELMAEAGYPDGFEFSIMVLTTYNKSVETCEMIVSDLAEVGSYYRDSGRRYF